MEDAILYAACFDANGGVFEPLLGADDAIVTDQLNHASIIDGVRLCKAKRFVYANADMADLEAKLEEAQSCRFRLIVTDGVFSMDGTLAPLPQICDLAEKHRATLMVDDSHATGFMGKTGRGTWEHHGVGGRVDLITTTFGKALGGALGGCTAGPKEVIGMLRQRSRPYLFSNSLAPAVVGATLRALELLTASTELRDRLEANTKAFRERMTAAGFEIKPGVHPIVPIMFSRFAPDDAPARPALRAGAARRGRLREGLLLPGGGEGASRASGCSSRPRTARSTSTGRWPPSRRWAGRWACWPPDAGGRPVLAMTRTPGMVGDLVHWQPDTFVAMRSRC